MSEQSTKAFIIKTAKQLFAEKSYNDVTIANICDACHISKTTFYYHLKSKEEIILHFYDTIVHDLSNQLVSILSQDNYWEQLVICFESLIKVAAQYGPDFFSQMFISNLKQDSGSYDLRSELTRIAVAITKKGQESGQIRNQSDPESLYVSSAYAYLGTELTWCIKKGDFEWQTLLRRNLECIYDVIPELRYS